MREQIIFLVGSFIFTFTLCFISDSTSDINRLCLSKIITFIVIFLYINLIYVWWWVPFYKNKSKNKVPDDYIMD